MFRQERERVAREPSAPPHPAGDPTFERGRIPPAVPVRVEPQVELPVLEVRPWVRQVQSALTRGSYGVLRIDLTRPTWQRVPGQTRPDRVPPGAVAPARGAPAFERPQQPGQLQYVESPPSASIIQGALLLL